MKTFAVVYLRRQSLDGRLAAGDWSQGGPLLAVRARQLITSRYRCRLAAHWDDLAVRARRVVAEPGGGPSTRADAEAIDLVDAVAAALRALRSVPAQGVALAATMRPVAGDAVDRLHTGGEDVLAAAARAVLTAVRQPPRPGPVCVSPRARSAQPSVASPCRSRASRTRV